MKLVFCLLVLVAVATGFGVERRLWWLFQPSPKPSPPPSPKPSPPRPVRPVIITCEDRIRDDANRFIQANLNVAKSCVNYLDGNFFDSLHGLDFTPSHAGSLVKMRDDFCFGDCHFFAKSAWSFVEDSQKNHPSCRPKVRNIFFQVAAQHLQKGRTNGKVKLAGVVDLIWSVNHALCHATEVCESAKPHVFMCTAVSLSTRTRNKFTTNGNVHNIPNNFCQSLPWCKGTGDGCTYDPDYQCEANIIRTMVTLHIEDLKHCDVSTLPGTASTCSATCSQAIQNVVALGEVVATARGDTKLGRAAFCVYDVYNAFMSLNKRENKEALVEVANQYAAEVGTQITSRLASKSNARRTSGSMKQSAQRSIMEIDDAFKSLPEDPIRRGAAVSKLKKAMKELRTTGGAKSKRASRSGAMPSIGQRLRAVEVILNRPGMQPALLKSTGGGADIVVLVLGALGVGGAAVTLVITLFGAAMTFGFGLGVGLSVGDALGQVLVSDIGPAIGGFIEQIGDSIGQLTTSVAGIIDSGAGFIDAVAGVINSVGGLITQAADSLGDLADSVVAFIDSGANFVNEVTDVFDQIGNFIEGVTNVIPQVVETFDDLVDVAEDVVDLIDTGLQFLGSLFGRRLLTKQDLSNSNSGSLARLGACSPDGAGFLERYEYAPRTTFCGIHPDQLSQKMSEIQNMLSA